MALSIIPSMLGKGMRGLPTLSVSPSRNYSSDSLSEAQLYAPRVSKLGRSSMSGITATVFGATGSVGRYVVNSLGKIGSEVILPYRGEESSWTHLKVMGDIGQISAIPFDIREPESMVHAMRGSNVVINLLGRDQDTRHFTMEQVHVDAGRMIAALCRELEIPRLIHMSAVGCSEDSSSKWRASKARSEAAVKEEFPEATIIRSAPFFGPADRYTNSFGYTLRFSPFFPLCNPTREVQPIYAPDIGTIVMAAVTGHNVAGNTYEVGGPVVYEEGALLNTMCDLLTLEPQIIEVNKDIATTLTSLFKYKRDPPLHENLLERQFSGDEVVAEGEGVLGLEDLGIDPTTLHSIENVGYKYLQHYQQQKNRYIV